MTRIGMAALLVGLWATAAGADDMVSLHAAGSLKAALGDVADAFEADTGLTVSRSFAPSGLLRQRIEDGEPAEVFASANMRHPQALAAAGLASPTVLLARNALCALAAGDLEVTTDTLLAVLLDEDVRVGTSTPKADPSGDYAFAVFDKADALAGGAGERLKGKALQLTGGPDSASPPEGRNPYGHVMESGQADIFLTYCTNAVLAQREVPALKIVTLPRALATGADYGLTVMNGAGADAWRLAFAILSPQGQAILARYGFTAPTLPAAAE
ncbi:molybdate ABC transporter substrate-binding protein [Acuticoccus sediminis]|uniref:Molybdate ABC transporter substrate-binding protein n=1 Tax=Acuticoccus sediminis TaxID=2184697 RepID=A0A8B2NR93_9HYPH|nr:molybdate ABC transporter substrate-binding protein [Acuticoccus sediminis]RAI02406.1 molybdate ABC transporter substrate-binding protein [Acuticoccus sediminis]